MKARSDLDQVPSHRWGRRMFGDYPIDGPGYWIWLANITVIFVVSLLLMFSLKA